MKTDGPFLSPPAKAYQARPNVPGPQSCPESEALIVPLTAPYPFIQCQLCAKIKQVNIYTFLGKSLKKVFKKLVARAAGSSNGRTPPFGGGYSRFES